MKVCLLCFGWVPTGIYMKGHALLLHLLCNQVLIITDLIVVHNLKKGIFLGLGCACFVFFLNSSILRKVRPILKSLCAWLVHLNRVLVGMDPHHHAQLLLCLPTPQGQDASSAGTTPAGDQPHGLPGSLQFLHFSSSIKPK